MDYAKLLDRLSNVSFLTGFVIGKFRQIPIYFLSMLFPSVYFFSAFLSVVSLTLLSSAYLLWILSCQLLPDHPRAAGHWYGFIQFKNQNKIAAVLGLLAVMTCILTVFSPLMMVVSMWLIVASNVLCSVSHYHKLKNPPLTDVNYSSSQQMSCLTYNLAMTSLSLLTAFSATLSFVCPLFGAALFGMTAFVGLLVGLVAFNYWLECNRDHPPDISFQSSYQQTGFVRGSSASFEFAAPFEFANNSDYNPIFSPPPQTQEDNDNEPQQPCTPSFSFSQTTSP